VFLGGRCTQTCWVDVKKREWAELYTEEHVILLSFSVIIEKSLNLITFDEGLHIIRHHVTVQYYCNVHLSCFNCVLFSGVQTE